ncbi:phage portal protein [Azospirillum doebereinerae]|nr:phage portal protein [Azospirillum doebereinerae]
MSKPILRVAAGDASGRTARPVTPATPGPSNRSNGLDAAQYGGRLTSFVPAAQHINALISSSGRTVTTRARYLRRNNGYVKAAAEAWKGDVIGTGFTPTVGDEALKALYNRWTWQADAEGVLDFEGMQRRAGDEGFVVGECFIRRRPRFPQDSLEVPVQLQFLPSEQCPAQHNGTAPGGNPIVQGIEYDRTVRDRRVAYWFHRGNPTDPTPGDLDPTTLVRVPARDVIHVFDPSEAGQRRGVCQFAAGIVPAWLLDVYEDAELDRKKVAALHAFFFFRPDLPDAENESIAPPPPITLRPGSTVTLPPGWDARPSTPADVGGAFEAFMFRALLRLCAALGVPYPLVTGDFSKVNFSSIRAQFIAYRRRVEAFQHAVIVFQLCRTVWRWFVEAAALAGRPELAPYRTELSAILDVPWQPPRWEWVDPLKDVKAEKEAVDGLHKPLSAVWEGLGEDPAANKARIEADLAWVKSLRDKGYLPPDKAAGAGAPPPAGGNQDGAEGGAATE